MFYDSNNCCTVLGETSFFLCPSPLVSLQIHSAPTRLTHEGHYFLHFSATPVPTVSHSLSPCPP